MPATMTEPVETWAELTARLFVEGLALISEIRQVPLTALHSLAEGVEQGYVL